MLQFPLAQVWPWSSMTMVDWREYDGNLVANDHTKFISTWLAQHTHKHLHFTVTLGPYNNPVLNLCVILNVVFPMVKAFLPDNF